MKPRILICAFACAADPHQMFFGGGDLMAWNVIKRLGYVYQLWVLTEAQNRKPIENKLSKGPLPNVRFVYVGLPAFLQRLARSQGGIQLVAYLWQWVAFFVALRLHRRVHFHAFHHLTYENDWMASVIGALLPVPYLRGPGGGAHRTPKAFTRRYPFRERLWERVRTAGQWFFRHDPFFALGQRRARVLLVCNEEALKATPARWRHKARLLPINGVPSAAFDRSTPKPYSDKRFRITTAGRLICLKGFDLAIRAFKEFLPRSGDDGRGAEFTIFGDGPQLGGLRRLARELGIEKQVRFEGWKPQEELWARLRSSDVFVFPSLRDGGGAVVVEAMAAGKPVVCFDFGGPGVHINAECGFKIPARDPGQAVRDMAAALEKLAHDQRLCAQMGRAAFERARQFYDWDRITERIVDEYEKALGIDRPPMVAGSCHPAGGSCAKARGAGIAL